MNQNKMTIGMLAVFGLILLANSVFYTVDEREKAIVVQLGQVIRFDDQAGIHFKLPLVQDVVFFDSRVLTLDAEPERYLTQEKKSVVVDSFVKWRIVNPLTYYVKTGGSETRAKILLQQWINGGLRDQFGKRTLHDVVAGERREIMQQVTSSVDKSAAELGMQVVDVRLQRVDLPQEVSQSVYDRMEAERARIAKELRAQGAEVAEKLRAEAERKRDILVAEAYRKAQQVRGEGDGKAAAIYARAYNTSPEFYSLYRSLTAYKASFQDKDDIMIVDPSADFFKYLKKSGGR